MKIDKNKFVRVEHLEYLNAVKKDTLASLESVKEVECAGNYYKVHHYRVVTLKGDYLKLENARRKELGLELRTSVGSLPWGKWEIEGVLIKHNDKMYLRYYPYKGDLQDSVVTLYDADDMPIPNECPLGFSIIDVWQKGRSGGNTVCRNVDVDNIVELTILDKDGDPDVDVITMKYEDEPDFVKKGFTPAS